MPPVWPFLQTLSLSFAPSRETLFLRPIVGARFQFVVLTGVAVKENDFLCGLVSLLRHDFSPLALLSFA